MTTFGRSNCSFIIRGCQNPDVSLTDRLKDSFVAGLVLVAPLAVTVFVLTLLADWSLAVVDPVVRETGLVAYTGNVELAAQATALAVMVAALTALGWVAQRRVGQRAFGRVGRIVNLVPLANTVYRSVRQVATAVVEGNTRYESVVLVEYPREGVYVLGLVTSDAPRAAGAVADEPVYSVYLPNSPNPTGGRLLLVPESELHETDMSVRQGLRTILTTGVAADDRAVGAEEAASEESPRRVRV